MPRRSPPTARLSALQPGRRVARRRVGIAPLVALAALLALVALAVAWLA
jgi:hypothetical protein